MFQQNPMAYGGRKSAGDDSLMTDNSSGGVKIRPKEKSQFLEKRGKKTSRKLTSQIL